VPCGKLALTAVRADGDPARACEAAQAAVEVGTDAVHIFPVGVPGLYRTVYAPADYIETVNTLGLPRYARQWQSANGKRVEMESQMNALSYCTRPKVLMVGATT
jgi:hypothetical protein